MRSRSIQTGGLAVHRAVGEVLEQAKQVAADLLEAAVEDVVYEPTLTHFHVVGTPAVSRTLADVAAAAPEGLAAQVDYQGSSPTFPFGAHIAVVEIDTETGKVRLRRLVAVDDAGRILNPLLVEGQVHGGLAQGIAQALFEEVRYDEDGNPITSNLADYAFVSAAELPSFETVHMETPTPVNELGAKGIGESGTIGATPAVQNAVVDSLAHLGVRHLDMPATPERRGRARRRGGRRGRARAPARRGTAPTGRRAGGRSRTPRARARGRGPWRCRATRRWRSRSRGCAWPACRSSGRRAGLRSRRSTRC